MTQSTVWDTFKTRRWRTSVILLGAGVVGFLIAGAILRLPLLLSIILALFVGAAGLGGAVLEMIIKAISRQRSPITFRAREPYEFVRYGRGFVNLARVTSAFEYTEDNEPKIIVWLGDEANITLSGEEAIMFSDLLDEFATPLRGVETTPVQDES